MGLGVRLQTWNSDHAKAERSHQETHTPWVRQTQLSLLEARCSLEHGTCPQTSSWHFYTVEQSTWAVGDVPRNKLGKCRWGRRQGLTGTAACPPAWDLMWWGQRIHTRPQTTPLPQGAVSGVRLLALAIGQGHGSVRHLVPSGWNWWPGISGRGSVLHAWPEGGSLLCVWSSWALPSLRPLK